MWCDNCLLVFPLRAGAIAWAVLVAAYSIAGGIFLLVSGQYFFFVFPEWQIYGGIGIGVAVTAALSMLALSNRSYIWIRVVKFLWPFVIITCAIRAVLMIVQLQRGKDKITWECKNGGQLWSEEAVAAASAAAQNAAGMPGGFCHAGFNSLNTAFIVGLLFDIVCQIYMFFLSWRFSKRLEHYNHMNGPYQGGYYKA